MSNLPTSEAQALPLSGKGITHLWHLGRSG